MMLPPPLLKFRLSLLQRSVAVLRKKRMTVSRKRTINLLRTAEPIRKPKERMLLQRTMGRKQKLMLYLRRPELRNL
jgi:hypothetical protein